MPVGLHSGRVWRNSIFSLFPSLVDIYVELLLKEKPFKSSLVYREVSCVMLTISQIVLRWLKTKILMCYDSHSLSIDATIMVSKNCPITVEHVGIIFVTQ